jgi:hypothetical protein
MQRLSIHNSHEQEEFAEENLAYLNTQPSYLSKVRSPLNAFIPDSRKAKRIE